MRHKSFLGSEGAQAPSTLSSDEAEDHRADQHDRHQHGRYCRNRRRNLRLDMIENVDRERRASCRQKQGDDRLVPRRHERKDRRDRKARRDQPRRDGHEGV